MSNFFDIPLMIDDADTKAPEQDPDMDTVEVSTGDGEEIEVEANQEEEAEADKMCDSMFLMLDKLEELEYYQNVLKLSKVTPQDIRVLSMVRGLDLEVSLPATESWDDRTSELYGEAAVEAIGAMVKKTWDWILRQFAKLGDMFKRFITMQGMRLKMYEKKIKDMENQIRNSSETNPDGKFQSADPDIFRNETGPDSFAGQMNAANETISNAIKAAMAASKTLDAGTYTAATSAVGKAENVVDNLLKATPKFEERNFKEDVAKNLLQVASTYINTIQVNQSAMNEMRKNRDDAQRQVSVSLKNNADPGPAKARVAAYTACLKIANKSFKLYTKQIDTILKSIQNYVKVCRGVKAGGDRFTADSNAGQ